MDFARAVSLFALVALSGACGCRLSEAGPERSAATRLPPTNPRQTVRDNSASLLYELLNEEKDLGKLLLVKRESKELNDLVKEIASAARAGSEKLESLAAADRGLHLQSPALPPGETATRDAVARTKTAALLKSGGAEFEFQLLLSQAEALNYGVHLAKVAAAHEPRRDHARAFTNLGDELKRLHDRVIARLQTHEHPHHQP